MKDEQPRSGPLKVIIGLFLLLILVAWVIPDYAVSGNPSPHYFPKIEEVISGQELFLREEPIQDFDELWKLIHPQDPAVKRIADTIVALSCTDTSPLCRAKAIFFFVQRQLRYVNDPTTFEYIKGPLDALVSQVGDCDDASVLAANLLLAVGIPARLVFVPGHVYVEAYLPDAPLRYKAVGDWVALDLTCRNCDFGNVASQFRNEEKRRIALQ